MNNKIMNLLVGSQEQIDERERRIEDPQEYERKKRILEIEG